MNCIERFYDTYSKYRTKYDLRMHIVCTKDICQLVLSRWSDNKIVLSIEAENTEKMYRMATKELLRRWEVSE